MQPVFQLIVCPDSYLHHPATCPYIQLKPVTITMEFAQLHLYGCPGAEKNNAESGRAEVCGSCPSTTSTVYHNHITPMWWSTLKAYYAHTGARRQERDPLKSYYMSDYALNMGDYPRDFMLGAGDKSSQSHTPTHTDAARVQQRQRALQPCLNMWSDDEQKVSAGLSHAPPCVSWLNQAFTSLNACVRLFVRKENVFNVIRFCLHRHISVWQ